MAKDIVIKGAKENNLKNVDLTIPRDKLVVFTGLSGSGKSSLAFDTIYAEAVYYTHLDVYKRQDLHKSFVYHGIRSFLHVRKAEPT